LVAGDQPYRPVAGLAVAPWRLHQVAGRVVGPEPSAPLVIAMLPESIRGLDSRQGHGFRIYTAQFGTADAQPPEPAANSRRRGGPARGGEGKRRHRDSPPMSSGRQHSDLMGCAPPIILPTGNTHAPRCGAFEAGEPAGGRDFTRASPLSCVRTWGQDFTPQSGRRSARSQAELVVHLERPLGRGVHDPGDPLGFYRGDDPLAHPARQIFSKQAEEPRPSRERLVQRDAKSRWRRDHQGQVSRTTPKNNLGRGIRGSPAEEAGSTRD
jgi:hypothetical protein